MNQRKNIAFTMIFIGLFVPILGLLFIDAPIKHAFRHRGNIVLVGRTYVCGDGREPAGHDSSLSFTLSDPCPGLDGRYEGGMKISYKSIVVLGAMLVFAGTMMLIWYRGSDSDQDAEAY